MSRRYSRGKFPVFYRAKPAPLSYYFIEHKTMFSHINTRGNTIESECHPYNTNMCPVRHGPIYPTGSMTRLVRIPKK